MVWIWVFSLALAATYAALLGWYRWAWCRLVPQRVPADWIPKTPVTVLVPARNEAANIEACLRSLVGQQYPAHLLEICVVNDQSEDDTALLVEKFSQVHPVVRLLNLQADPQIQAHKKRAIALGVEHAKGALIACTDADCTMGQQWLRALVYAYEVSGAKFIAAPVAFHTQPTALSVFQTLDFMTLQGISGASVSQGFHTMCNGANLAYTRQAFQEVGGFAGIDALPTGDDMLLMYKIYLRYPEKVVWLKNAEAIVTTEACASVPAFLNQRIRWASKAAFFDDRRMFWVLLLVYLLNVAAGAGLIAALVWPACWLPVLLLWASKWVSEWMFLQPVAQFFGQSKWLPWLLPLQVPHVAYTILAGWLGRFGSYTWKGRTITTQAGITASGHKRLKEQHSLHS